MCVSLNIFNRKGAATASVMKQIIVISLILQIVACRPHSDKDAEITWYRNFNDGVGNFEYGYETTNGIRNFQKVERRSDNAKRSVISMRGFFAFVAPDNSKQEVRYISDEHGYHPHVTLSALQESNEGNIRQGKAELDKSELSQPSTLSDFLIQNATATVTTASNTITPDMITTTSETILSISTTEQAPKDGDTNDKESSDRKTDGQPITNAAGELSKNSTKQTEPVDFPDRIGQPAIISLQGPPG